MGFSRLHRATAVAGIVIVLAGFWVLPASADLDLAAGDAGIVANSAGDGVNVRTEPSIDAGILTTLPEGWPLTIVDGSVSADDGASWYAISTETELGAVSGWVRADFVSAPSMGTSLEGLAAVSSTPMIVAAGDEGLNLRAAPSLSADIIGGMPDGATVELLSPETIDADGIAWSQVNYNGATGYSATMFLVEASAEEAPTVVEPATTTEATVSETAVVTGTSGDGIMVRAEPSGDSGPVSAIFEGTTIAVLGEPVADESGQLWYQTEVEGTVGWVNGAYLSSETPVVAAEVLTLGDLFLDEALNYLGTPYVWAGSDPSGFDCSGFTYYIVNLVTGADFPRAIEDQIVSGAYVPYDELQPGDLVFFENTYTEGLSHVGFYVGDGQFLSATGTLDSVGIASLSDPYWSTRYLTARRLS